MRTRSPRRELPFMINEVARLLRTFADQEARQLGMTRAQWAVLARLERHEGLKQAELADMLDMQPISLTRLVDRLADSGLIERRSDPNDRRAKRLYLTEAAKPVMQRLDVLGEQLAGTLMAGIPAADIDQMLRGLGDIKANLRRVLHARGDIPEAS